MKSPNVDRKRKYWWQFWLPKMSVREFYEDLRQQVEDVSEVSNVARGRVTKVKAKPEYTPNPKRGGRVTRVMPKPLRKIKEEQEKPIDVSDLPR